MRQFITNKNHTDFWLFWFAQLISQLGDRVHQMALVGLIAVRAPGSSVELAKLLAFTIIPVFIIGPIAGVLVDRWDRRTVLFITDFIRGVLVLCIAFWFMHLPSLIPLYTSVFIIFALSRFHVPAKMSFIPDMVASKDLTTANSLLSMTGMIAFVLGAIIGGLLVEYTGSQGGFLWDAVTFIISGVLVLAISPLRLKGFNKERFEQVTKEMLVLEKNVWQEINHGVRYIISENRLRRIFVIMSILFAAVGAIYVVAIVFIQQSFNSVTKDLGFLAIPLGGGLCAGALSFAKWGKTFNRYRVIFMSLLCGGVMLGAFALSVHYMPVRPLAIAMVFILGAVVGPIMIAANTIIHEVCHQQMSGKVFAALEIVMHAAFLVAMLLSSYLAEHVARVWILLGVSGIFITVAYVGLIQDKVKNT